VLEWCLDIALPGNLTLAEAPPGLVMTAHMPAGDEVASVAIT
jgi:hypothetical protein